MDFYEGAKSLLAKIDTTTIQSCVNFLYRNPALLTIVTFMCLVNILLYPYLATLVWNMHYHPENVSKRTNIVIWSTGIALFCLVFFGHLFGLTPPPQF